MKKRLKQESKWFDYVIPILWGSYPALTLLVSNLEQVQPDIILRPLLVSTILVYGVYLILLLITHNINKSVLIAFIFTIAFFSYGHIYTLLEGDSINGFVFGRHRYLTSLWIALFAGLIWWAWTRISISANLISMIRLTSIALIIIPVFQISSYLVQVNSFKNTGSNSEQATEYVKPDQLPDVYYIILDMYGRSDKILEEVGYDNSEFIHYLESKGFYVAKCSQSNFNHTQFSLAVSLNMKYFTEQDGVDVDRMGSYIKKNVVRQEFEKLGYQTVAFQTGFNFTEWKDATYYFETSNSTSSSDSIGEVLNSFEVMFIRTTLLASPMEANIRSIRTNEGNEKRMLTMFILNKLKEVPDISGPKFVFVHLNTTHPPFVFGPNGEAVDEYADMWEPGKNEAAFLQGYHDSIIYSDSQMEKVIDAILEKSKTPPIIILQGDHGLQMTEGGRRMDILNAFYLPDGGNDLLYPDITPVNSFRIVLNKYFGGNYPLLKDQSYSARVGASPVMLDNNCAQ